MSQPSSVIQLETTMNLPFDIITSIFEALEDRNALYASLIVSKTFHEVAILSLYREIDLRPSPSDETGRRALDTIMKYPYLRNYVRRVNQWRPNICALVPGAQDCIHETSFLSTFSNLRSYSLYPPLDGPPIFPANTFSAIVAVLLQLPKGQLRELNLHFNVYSHHFHSLVKLGGLRRITLDRPSRYVLDNLPKWMGEMRETLEEFHILNGAKVELLFISRIQPHLVNLRSLKLGPLRFLSSVEFLGVLRDTPKLEELDFHYNNWANLSLEQPTSTQAPKFSGLPNLQVLKITHEGVGNSSQYNEMLRWVLQLTTSNSTVSLENLSIISDDHRETVVTPYFSSFILRYMGKLRALRVPFVKFTAWEMHDVLLKPGKQLREVEIGVNQSNSFIEELFNNEELRLAAKTLRTLRLRPGALVTARIKDNSTLASNRRMSFIRLNKMDLDVLVGPANLVYISVEDQLVWEKDRQFEESKWVKRR